MTLIAGKLEIALKWWYITFYKKINDTFKWLSGVLKKDKQEIAHRVCTTTM